MFDIAGPDLAPALSVPFGLIENGFARLANLVKAMPREALEYRGPDGKANSTATLIAHLARVDLEYLHIIMGQPVPRELQEEYGPYQTAEGRLPEVTGRSAAELLAHYRRVIDMARDYLKTRPDDEAARQVKIPWWSEPATVRYVLWHMASHSMYHQGQIRRLQLTYTEA